MRTFLQGPQELSITDGATAEVGQIWQRLGGQTAQLQSLRWTKLLCPAQFGGDFVARQSRLARFAQFATKPLLKGCDALLRRHPRGKIRSDARMELQPLTASAMSTHWPALHTGRRLRPDYDPSFFHWLLTEMNRVPSRGPLVARQVILGTRMLGWYLFYLTPERVAEVVQITFAAGQAEAVIGALLADADERNAIVVQGRLEPELTEPLARYGALMQYREPLALVHSRDEAILSAFQTGQAYLTRADGEWWAGFHLEQFS